MSLCQLLFYVCLELVSCVPCNLILFFDTGGDGGAELSREQL